MKKIKQYFSNTYNFWFQVKKDRKISIINEDENVNFDKDVWKTPTNVRIIKESTYYVNMFLSAA